MGTPLPKNPQGVIAPVCWGPGEPFGDNGTPSIIHVKFVDWVEGAFFEERFRNFLTQSQPLYQTGSPIAFHSENNSWVWSLAFGNVVTSLWLNYKPRFPFTFQQLAGAKCTTGFANDNIDPGSNIVAAGAAILSWSEIWN